MITSSNTNKYSYIKRILTLGIVGCTIFLIACTAEKTEDVAAPTAVKVVEGFNLFSVKDFKNPGLPEGTLVYLDGKAISLTELKDVNPESIDYDVLLTMEAAKEKYGAQITTGVYELFSLPTTSTSIQPGKEYLPSFPGGKEQWSLYLQKNLRYPDIAIDKGTMGMAKIAFTVMPDGSLKDLRIVQNPGDSLGEEALRLISKGPKWVPGRVNGKLTEQRVLMPITYRLE